MVGNSLRSDILPVVKIGGWAVHIPAALSWSHEHADPTPAARQRFYERRKHAPARSVHRADWRRVAALNEPSLSNGIPTGTMARPFRHKANGAFHGSKSRSRLRSLRPSVWCCGRSGAEDPPPRGDSIDSRVRLLLGRGEACAAIASGDIIDVDTLLTSTPNALSWRACQRRSSRLAHIDRRPGDGRAAQAGTSSQARCTSKARSPVMRWR